MNDDSGGNGTGSCRLHGRGGERCPVDDDPDDPCRRLPDHLDRWPRPDPTETFTLRADRAVNIASTQVDLQMRPDDLEAMKDSNTDGGRTKIDLEWDRTYSHDPTPGGSRT